MLKILRDNYLLILDIVLRIVISILLPKVLGPEVLAQYNYVLVLLFWFMLADAGSSLGFSLRVVERYRSDSINVFYVIQSFLISFFLSTILIIIYFSVTQDKTITLKMFFLAFLILMVYSFLTTIFKGLGLYKYDFLSKILVSLSLVYLLFLINNLDVVYYIMIPYLVGSIILLFSFLYHLKIFYLRAASFIKIAFYNIKRGFFLYLTNSLLILFSLMDRVVFSGIIHLELFGNYLFCYSISSLHILAQNQITSKYYRLILSPYIENNKKIRLLLFSLIGHLVLFVLIILIIDLDFFKEFYPKYSYINQYIILTELVCISISILTVLYLVINSINKNFSFLFLSYVGPIVLFIFFKTQVFMDLNLWLIGYLFELLLAIMILRRLNFFSSARSLNFRFLF